MEYLPLTNEEERIGTAIVDSAFKIHTALGPGLLEKIYEACLAHELKKRGFDVQRQVTLPIQYDGLEFDEGLRLDLLVNDLVVIELKAVESVNELWKAQLISHLKLLELDLGYLINFNVPLIKNGIQRIRV
jgi:GxxExxY protein